MLLDSELTKIRCDWEQGKAFGQYVGVYHHGVFLKLGEIQALMACTAESIELEERDDREDKQRQKAEELTGDG